MNAPSPNASESQAPRSLVEAIIAKREIGVAFQPIVDLNDGMIIAYEALSRPAPESGFARPDLLFEAAEKHGLLWDLEEVTRSASLQAAVNWPRDVKLFINTSPEVFADERFARVLVQELTHVPGVQPDRIVLEITELSQQADDSKLVDQVKLAKAAGFQVAVDDAGAGTSGLNRMMVLRPQWIKLDRQFVRGIDTDQFRQNLVKFFVHFARLSGVHVLAEGLESAKELSTIIGLGVRYGQGFFLGMPGERATTTDAQFVAEVRERWASVDINVPQSPREMPLARLCKPIIVVRNPSATVSDASNELLTHEDSIGVLAAEGKHLSGWVSREAVYAAAGTNPLGALRDCLHPVTCVLCPEATLDDAMQMLCLREDHDLAYPLIIADGAEILGAVRLRDLLRAAVSEQRTASTLRAPLTGLPARVRADQHLEEMIDRASDPLLRRSPVFHADAAFIDIRRFADFNTMFGYEMGDRLIRELSDLIRQTLGEESSSVFIAHLGDDRFLISGRSGSLEPALQSLIEAFEKRTGAAGDVVYTFAGGQLPGPGSPMGLRVLVLPRVFEHVQHPREVYRLEQRLRQRARSQEQLLAPHESLFLSDPRLDGLVGRKSA